MTPHDQVQRGPLEPPWVVRADVAAVTGPDRVVVLALKPSDSTPLELAGAGLAIWQLIDGRRRTADIVSEICHRFEVETSTVAPDVTAFLHELERAGVLERGPVPDRDGAVA